MKTVRFFLLASSMLFSTQILAAPNSQIGDVSFLLVPGAATSQSPEVSFPSSPYTITCAEEGLEADQGYIYVQVSPTDTAQLDPANPQHQFTGIMPTKKSDGSGNLNLEAEWVWHSFKSVIPIVVECTYQAVT